MNRLPLLVSVPHAGLRIPDEVDGLCTLTEEEIAADGDVGAAEIYQVAQDVEAYVLADVARAIVDLNRAEDDRRKDGVVKTHTCWDVPVYRQRLSEDLIQTLLERYHRPYHRRLTELGRSGRFRVGVDCHTMAAHGPPVGPDPGIERPWVCVGDGDGACPQSWVRALADRFREALGGHVSINVPFRGGYIVRAHGSEMPWLQLELSRAPFRSSQEKRMAVLQALRRWCELDLAGAV